MTSKLYTLSIRRRVEVFIVLVALFLGLATMWAAPVNFAQKQKQKAAAAPATTAASGQEAIWQNPGDIRTRNLFYGPGGRDGQPKGRLTFVEEDMDATSPKFVVKDEAGAKWKIKLGPEAQPETVATRLLWAVGYFVDESYYMPHVKVENLPRLRRGQEFVTDGGVVTGARLERDPKGDKKAGDWDWFDNPFTGTRELNGLRVMMVLINNWDLKKQNNSIRPRQGVERAYYVSDLGASFGQTGGWPTRTLNDQPDYSRSRFIQRTHGDKVDFFMSTRPLPILMIIPPFYMERARRQQIAKNIPRADVRWIASLLGQLSQEQLNDAFRAASYSQEEAAEYTKAVNERILELKLL
jgi:hypothetical protein